MATPMSYGTVEEAWPLPKTEQPQEQSLGSAAFLDGAQAPQVTQPMMSQPLLAQSNQLMGYPQPQMYGLEPMKRPQGGFNCVMMVISLFFPWILFCVIYCVVSFSYHQHRTQVMYAIVWVIFALVMLLGMWTLNLIRLKSARSDLNWLLFLFATSLVAWIAAYVAGQTNFIVNLQPYYDETGLNFYPAVDPSLFEGQQLMDAGRILFTANSHLDLTKSMGFRNLDMYCVTPIVSGNMTNAASYDFWAVGVNCCAGHASMFQCGEFNNPNAHAGLRLMRDDQRPFFRLAVQEAEAAYNIRASHPIFLTWMSDPLMEVHAYEDNGYRYFLLGVFVHFACQLFLVIVGSLVFSKFGLV